MRGKHGAEGGGEEPEGLRDARDRVSQDRYGRVDLLGLQAGDVAEQRGAEEQGRVVPVGKPTAPHGEDVGEDDPEDQERQRPESHVPQGFGLDGDVGLTAGMTLSGCASACSRFDSMSF